MTDIDKRLDEILEPIKEDRWINYQEIKQAIKQLIEEVKE